MLKTLWGGFTDGNLDFALPRDEDAATDYGPAALYKTKAEAQRHYEDVRRVEITVID